MLKRLAFLLSFALLTACVGTGTTSVQAVQRAVYVQDGSVYVYRGKMFMGSGNVAVIELNNKPLGELGIKQTIIGKAKSGENILKATLGLSKVFGDNVLVANFQSDGKKNRYFIYTFRQTFWKNVYDLLEVTEDSFKKSLGS